MKITFEQFRKDPQKALMFTMIFAMSALYIRAERQSNLATAQCEKRLIKCETELRKMSAILKTQDSLCSALVTEIKIYKALGKI